MKSALISLLACGSTLWGWNQQPLLEPAEFNVNSRYTVESVDLPRDAESRISRGLRQDIQSLIGNHLNTSALSELARRLRQELNARTVTHRVVRGTAPDRVKVVLEVGRRKNEFELSVPKFLYHSNEGWTAAVQASTSIGNNRFSAGLVSDGDELAERFAGVRARYERRQVAKDRVRLSFAVDSYHQQWNAATLRALDGGASSEIYRTRQNFEPAVTIVLARPLTLSLGASFQRLEKQFPAARTDSSNTAVTTLRYDWRQEGSGVDQQHLGAGYSLRAATRVLSSDFVYGRHRVEVRYSITRGRHTISDEAIAGVITGRAPLFERYVLGTSSLLRGWNKYELDPLGGTRVAHNSLDYRYGMLELFYDVGSVWDRGLEPIARHSVGVGLRKSSFLIALAFPIKDGRVIPAVMVGMNY